MNLRTLGHRVQEMDAGPVVVLLADSTPIAYQIRDSLVIGRLGVLTPGWYRTDRRFSKGHTRAINKWLEGKDYSSVPHAQVVAVFNGINRFEGEAAISQPVKDFAEAVMRLARDVMTEKP